MIAASSVALEPLASAWSEDPAAAGEMFSVGAGCSGSADSSAETWFQFTCSPLE